MNASEFRDLNVRPYFQTVKVEAELETNETEERIKELQKKIEFRCPVYTMISEADVEMVESWKQV